MYTEEDFARLKFLEGRWQGTAPDGSAFHEQYDFPGPGVLRSQRFADAKFAHAIDGSTVVLEDGVVESRWGAFTWKASSIVDGKACFEPVEAPGRFCWERIDDATVHVVQRWTDADGKAREMVVPLRRVAGDD